MFLSTDDIRDTVAKAFCDMIYHNNNKYCHIFQLYTLKKDGSLRVLKQSKWFNLETQVLCGIISCLKGSLQDKMVLQIDRDWRWSVVCGSV